MTHSTPIEDAPGPTRRADTYALLSNCFHEPDEDVLALLAEAASVDVVVDVDALQGVAEDLERLRVDHSKLFVGPFEVLAPPYGSTYLDGEEQVMTESTIDVKERYRKEGLDIGLDEPPDHVSAELEFASVLARAEGAALSASEHEVAAEYVHRQADFLTTHLGAWLPAFTDRVDEYAQTEFYRRLAAESASFVNEDVDRVVDRRDRIAAGEDVVAALSESE
ncbi:MAG: TorD/DmsD family molecular chaperone [Halobacteriota archaeon]